MVMSASPIFRKAQRQKTTTWPLGCPAWVSSFKIVPGLRFLRPWIFDGPNPQLVGGDWNMTFMTFHIVGMSQSQVTHFFIFPYRGNNNPK